MALFSFFLSPSADVHLVLNPSSRKTLQLDVIGFDDTTGSMGSILSNSTFLMADPSIATVTSGGQLTAVKEGITFLTVGQTGSTLQMVARIWVHDSVVSFFPGNKSASVNAGTDNLLLSVFAEFSKGDIEDVTAHPYFSFQSANTAIAQVNSTSGRVKGISSGSTTITITELINNTVITPTPITINVNASLSTARPIVEKISFKGYGAEKRNILFLAEGFTAGEKSKFTDVVRAIDTAMRNSILHEPYRLLSNDYNTWMAFDPSKEGGITIGPALCWREDSTDLINYLTPVFKNEAHSNTANFTLNQLIDIVGFPSKEQKDSSVFTLAVATSLWNTLYSATFNQALLTGLIFDAWQFSVNEYRSSAKDTALGLINGGRLGERYGIEGNSDKPDNSWYRSGPTVGDFFYKDFRTISSGKLVDYSRTYFNNSTPLSFLWTSEFFEYLNSLTELSPVTPGFNIGNKWNLHGDDQGLVIVIVNLEYHAGNCLLYPNIFGGVSIGRQIGIDVPNLAGVKLQEYTPPDINVSGRFIEPIAATTIHELSHAMNLGDEYDDFRQLGNLTPQASSVLNIETYHNLNTIQNINLRGTKWELGYFRINKSSALLSDSVIGTTPNTLEIELFPGEGSKWNNNDVAVLMTKNLNLEAAFLLYPKNISHQINIVGVKVIAKSGDQITVSIPAITGTTVFPKGSMLGLPKIFGSDILKIHLPGVLDFLNNGQGTFPPLPTNFGLRKIDLTKLFSSKNGNCATANTAMTPTPLPIPHVSISGSIKHRLLGLHEGAGGYNCGVVRTAAVCKMRSEYMTGKGHFRFCHLCKYIIVQEINPSKHSNLESQYPGSAS